MVFMRPVILMLFLVMSSGCEELKRAEARPLPFLPQQSNSKIFASLGMVCKCCDGVGHGDAAGGECTASWSGSCSNLQCLPWKSQ